MSANLANLAADGNGYTLRLDFANVRGKLRREGRVHSLLFWHSWSRQIYKRAGVHINVEVASCNCFSNEIFNDCFFLLY